MELLTGESLLRTAKTSQALLTVTSAHPEFALPGEGSDRFSATDRCQE